MMKTFIAFCRPYFKNCVVIFLSILLLNALNLAFPYFVKVVIDQVIGLSKFYLLHYLFFILLAVVLLRFLVGILKEYQLNWMTENVVRDLRVRLFEHYLKLSVHYIETHRKGEMISSLTADMEAIKRFIYNGFIDVIYSLFTIVLVGGVLLYWNIKLSATIFVFLPVLGVLYYRLVPDLEKKYMRIRQLYAEFINKINDMVGGIRVIAAFGKRAEEKNNFKKLQTDIVQKNIKTNFLNMVLGQLAELISGLGIIVLFWLGSMEVHSGNLSVGTLMAFYAYSGMLFVPVMRLITVNSIFRDAKAALLRVNAVFVERPCVSFGRRRGKEMSGDILFKHVSFGYDNGSLILKDISLEIEEGESVALVGASGQGKTTFLNLLLRFYDPLSGVIFVGKNDLRKLSLVDYRERLGVVLQDDYLFSGTLEDNIAYAKTAYSIESIQQIAKKALAYDFIEALPHKYNTTIGERGVALSGGQRQRISLARALYRNPKILILDEPTSGVDALTEKAIVSTCLNKSDRTTIIISHRLSSICDVDKIVVLDDGKVAEIGKHKDLLAYGEKYAAMWHAAKQDGEFDFQEAV